MTNNYSIAILELYCSQTLINNTTRSIISTTILINELSHQIATNEECDNSNHKDEQSIKEYKQHLNVLVEFLKFHQTRFTNRKAWLEREHVNPDEYMCSKCREVYDPTQEIMLCGCGTHSSISKGPFS